MGGLAARLAGERYLGVKIERGKHSRELTEALGGLKGPLMKVAQMLATIPEAGRHIPWAPHREWWPASGPLS
ncbi:MAG: hypothetical protein AAFW76_06140, partial [Pseudomonadota bacterium]